MAMHTGGSMGEQIKPCPLSGKGRAALPPSGPEVAHSQCLTPLVTLRGKEKNEVGVAIWGNVYTPRSWPSHGRKMFGGTELGLYLPLLPLSPLFTFRNGALPPWATSGSDSGGATRCFRPICLAFHNKCMQLTVGEVVFYISSIDTPIRWSVLFDTMVDHHGVRMVVQHTAI